MPPLAATLSAGEGRRESLPLNLEMLKQQASDTSLDANNNFNGNGSYPLMQTLAPQPPQPSSDHPITTCSPSSKTSPCPCPCSVANCDAESQEFDRFANQCFCDCLHKAYADMKQNAEQKVIDGSGGGKDALGDSALPPPTADDNGGGGPMKITLRQLIEQSVSLMIDQLICNELWPKLPEIMTKHARNTTLKSNGEGVVTDESLSVKPSSKLPPEAPSKQPSPPLETPLPVVKPRNLVIIKMPIDVRARQSPVWFTRCDMADLAQKPVTCLLDMTGHRSKPTAAATVAPLATSPPVTPSLSTGPAFSTYFSTQPAPPVSTFVPVHTMRVIPSLVQAELRIQPPAEQSVKTAAAVAIPVKTTLAQMPNFLQPVIEIKGKETTAAADAAAIVQKQEPPSAQPPSTKEGKSTTEGISSAAEETARKKNILIQPSLTTKAETAAAEAAAEPPVVELPPPPPPPRAPLDLTGFTVATTEVSTIASRFHRRTITYAELLEFPLTLVLDVYYISEGFTPREEVAIPSAVLAEAPVLANAHTTSYRPLVIKSATTAIGPLLSFPWKDDTGEDLLSPPTEWTPQLTTAFDDDVSPLVVAVPSTKLTVPAAAPAVPVIAEPEPPTPVAQIISSPLLSPEVPATPSSAAAAGAPLLAYSERLLSQEKHEAMPHPEEDAAHKSPGQQYHYRYRRRRKTQLWGPDGNSDDESRSFSYNIQQSKSTGHLHRSYLYQNHSTEAEVEPKRGAYLPPPSIPVPPPPVLQHQQQQSFHPFPPWASSSSHLGDDLIGSYVSICSFVFFINSMVVAFPTFVHFADPFPSSSSSSALIYICITCLLRLTRCRSALGGDVLLLTAVALADLAPDRAKGFNCRHLFFCWCYSLVAQESMRFAFSRLSDAKFSAVILKYE